MGRAPCCQKVGLKRGRWAVEEDQILIKYIQDHGEGSWRSLPKNAGLLRCGKSCRLRWVNYLKKDLKRGNITPQEEDLIIKLHALLGNRWSLIASQLSGRTDNEIKNHWNSHLRRSIDVWIRPTNDCLPQHILDNLAKLMAKPNPSTEKKHRKIAPTAKEIKDDGTNNNDDEVCQESLSISDTDIWSEQSFQTIVSLSLGEEQQMGDEKEIMSETAPFQVEEDDSQLLSLNDMATNLMDQLMMAYPHGPSELPNPSSATHLDELLNDLTDMRTGHAEMDITAEHSLLPTPTISSSSSYTFDQLMNMSSAWNWEDCVVHAQDQDLMNDVEGSSSSDFMSWLLDLENSYS